MSRLGEWMAFWSLGGFIRDLPGGPVMWSNLFTGKFAELFGIRREITTPRRPAFVSGFQAMPLL